jgi:hypothetical protein
MSMDTTLLVMWAWEYDAEFIDTLRRACVRRGVAHHIVNADGMAALPAQLEAGEIKARVGIDRVWDWGDDYEAHVPAVQKALPRMLNDYGRVRETWNKPGIHYQLMKHGLRVPYLFVLPSVERERHIHNPPDLSPLKGGFSIKGAHSGGSGVVRIASHWDAVLAKRMEWPSDETILQEWVEPKLLGKRRAWFRVYYACGVAYLCWQNDRNHIIQPVTPTEEREFGLGSLRVQTQLIASIVGLNVFSTEIALDNAGNWVVVDYVNEPCDYRRKSSVTNGVPDEIVDGITARIAGWAARISSSS